MLITFSNTLSISFRSTTLSQVDRDCQKDQHHQSSPSKVTTSSHSSEIRKVFLVLNTYAWTIDNSALRGLTIFRLFSLLIRTQCDARQDSEHFHQQLEHRWRSAFFSQLCFLSQLSLLWCGSCLEVPGTWPSSWTLWQIVFRRLYAGRLHRQEQVLAKRFWQAMMQKRGNDGGGKMRKRRRDGRWQAGFLPLSAEPNNHLVLAQFQLQSPRRLLESSYQVWPACLPPPAAWRRQVRGHQCLLAWRRCGRRTRWGRKRWRSSTLRRSRKKNGPTSQETTMTKIVFQFRNHD